MRLSELARALGCSLADITQPPASPQATPDPVITAATHNAAWAGAGSVFVAIRGARVDGHEFAVQAAHNGAVAVMGEGWTLNTPPPLPYLQVPDARRALAEASAELAGHPSRELRVVGVTGTDGKTTTSWLTRHLLRAAGLPTGLLSTVGYELMGGELRQFPAHFSTPEAPQVQSILREMVLEGADAVVLEASSHALALGRVHGVNWDAAIWTNLTGEHLDFHGTMEGYFADKRRLIEAAPFAVLNADDPWAKRLRGVAPTEASYSMEAAADWQGGVDWRATDIRENADGLSFSVHSPLGEFAATLPMVGRFNVANALAAMAAAAHLGADTAQLQAGLRTFAGVPGRMQLVTAAPDNLTAVHLNEAPRVIVDFAHTPPSLEKALDTLRATTTGQLWVVIGSAGGGRDPSKRAPLGKVATRFAHHAIFTEEDCRDTPLDDILGEMARGAREGGRSNFQLIPDRREAIRCAVAGAKAGDTVLLAGKGPEDTLERASETLPWNEVAEASEALRLRAHKE